MNMYKVKTSKGTFFVQATSKVAAVVYLMQKGYITGSMTIYSTVAV